MIRREADADYNTEDHDEFLFLPRDSL